MQLKLYRRRIQHKLWLGGFETIAPTVEYEAVIDSNEDYDAAEKELDRMLENLWHRKALEELRMVARRRGQDDGSLAAIMNGIKSAMR